MHPKAPTPPTSSSEPPCEAERRILMALHAMELDWGSGMFDYSKIRGILAGKDTEQCEHDIGSKIRA